MRVLNLLSTGGVGGIEQLCKNIGKYAGYKNTFCFLFGEGYICKEMQSIGLDVVSLAGISKKKFSWKRWKKLCEIVKDYDIIVTHHCAIAPQFYYILLHKKFKEKKYVMTMHSCFERKYNYNYGSAIKNKCAEYILKSALFISDKIIFVSKAGKKSYIKNFNITDSKTAVVYNGIEIPDCYIPENNKSYYRLTYIGRVEKIKGIHLLVNAVKISLQHGYPVRLWIIGDCSYMADLKEQVKKLNLNDYISFLGIKRDIGNYLLQTDVFIYPSICEEVFGISVVEAMSYGVPCISNCTGGIPEIIENGINGYISEKKTGNGIFHAISKVLDRYKDGTIIEMKKNCLASARKFSIENTLLGLKKEYEELLNHEKAKN